MSIREFNPNRTFNVEQIENINNEKALLSLFLSATKSSIILIPSRDNRTNASS